MRKFALLILAFPSVVLAEAWRPSDFEISSWNMAASATDTCNSAFSPIGLAISMAMLGEATTGEHRAQIAQSMGIMSDFASTFAFILESYANTSASNAVSISFAPSIWSRKIKAMDIEYRQAMSRIFGAVSDRISTPLPVNAWTEAATYGKIAEIVTESDMDADLLLLNAIGFEGAWKKEFDRSRTCDTNFRTDDGKTRKIACMHGESTVTRIRSPEFTAIRLPFAADGMNMIYMLPPAGMDIGKFRAQIGNGISIDEIKSRFRAGIGIDVETLPLKLSVPRMELRSRWDLNNFISHFNIPTNGYSRLGETLKLDRVIQSAYIKVDERGYSLTPGQKPPPKPKKAERGWRHDDFEEEESAATPKAAKESFLLNRPFVYMVWDANTDTIILAGQFTGISP